MLALQQAPQASALATASHGRIELGRARGGVSIDFVVRTRFQACL